MPDHPTKPRIGPYLLTRRLSDGVAGPRFLALHERDGTSHMIARLAHVPSLEAEDRPSKLDSAPHRGSIASAEFTRAQLDAALTSAATLKHAHLLAIDAFGFDPASDDPPTDPIWPWIASPYTGDVDGLVSVASLMKRKGGYLPAIEARTATIQILQAVAHAHAAGFRHGPIAMEQVQVDRRGSLAIEHYGLAASLVGTQISAEELEQRELASVLEMAYQLVTGLAPEHPLIRAGRMIPDLDPLWDDWFETGLLGRAKGRAGFRSAAHALSAIMANGQNARSPEGMIHLIRRMSRLLTPRL
jgi:hypothetical protein